VEHVVALFIVRPTNLVSFLVIQETNGTLIVRVWIVIVVFDRLVYVRVNVFALFSAFNITVNAFDRLVFLFD